MPVRIVQLFVLEIRNKSIPTCLEMDEPKICLGMQSLKTGDLTSYLLDVNFLDNKQRPSFIN